MQQQQETTAPALVLAPGEQACSKDPSKKATHSYFWDWGESGVVCAEQAAVLQQLAPQLQRTVTIAPLGPQAPPELTRDERIRFYATEKALQYEVEDLKLKGLELYRNNEALRSENRLHVVRKAQADEERERLELALQQAGEKNAELTRENAELLNKLERAQTLAAFAPRGSELGLEQQRHVVDGDR